MILRRDLTTSLQLRPTAEVGNVFLLGADSESAELAQNKKRGQLTIQSVAFNEILYDGGDSGLETAPIAVSYQTFESAFPNVGCSGVSKLRPSYPTRGSAARETANEKMNSVGLKGRHRAGNGKQQRDRP